MSDQQAFAALEAAYLAARDARDRLDMARVRGVPQDTRELRAHADEAEAQARRLAAGIHEPAGEDARALAAIRSGLATAFDDEAEGLDSTAVGRDDCVADADGDGWRAAIAVGGAGLRSRLERCFGLVADSLELDGRQTTRLGLLARLAHEPDERTRRRAFLALAPVWRTVDREGDVGSPYRALIRETARRWADGQSPIAANEAALGLPTGTIERWAEAVLDAWRVAITLPARSRGQGPIEPWDWWWTAGALERAWRGVLPLERVIDLNRSLYKQLGADLEALGITFDTAARPGRPTLPVAFTSFGARPTRTSDGTWSPGAPLVMADLAEGGMDDLNLLVHETGHAIHIAAIRTRPAFADWPDSDALTEAIAELVALDLAEPGWSARWMPDRPPLPAGTSLRCRYAEVMLDTAWALFEIRLLADPGASPNTLWTRITSHYLGIAAHPEWSWWAIRGQLVQEPGYMANYALGAVLAADLRHAIRHERGSWIDGDPGWYGWVSEHLFRFGLERPSGAVLHDVLGRPPDERALLHEIGRAAG